MPSLTLTKITKSFDQQPVLDEIGLFLELGNSLALVGHNGVGKTTLIRIIAGQLLPDKGKMVFDQAPFGEQGWPESIRFRLGVSLGISMLPPELTPYEFLSFVGQLYRLNTSEWKERRDSLLDFLLSQKDHHKLLRKLSSGNQMKIAVAAAYLPNPDLVLLDEPFSNLDAVGTQQVVELIQGRKRQAVTIISSHNLVILPEICDHIGILHECQWAYLGNMGEFLSEGKEQLSKHLLEILQPQKDKKSKLTWQG